MWQAIPLLSVLIQFIDRRARSYWKDPELAPALRGAHSGCPRIVTRMLGSERG